MATTDINVAPELSLEERKFNEETTAKKRELDLKEREIAAKEHETEAKVREVAAKEHELNRSRWMNPTVIGLYAAAFGLIGSVIVARVNNQNTQQVERARSQSSLVLEAIKTGDPDAACKNLVFFVGRLACSVMRVKRSANNVLQHPKVLHHFRLVQVQYPEELLAGCWMQKITLPLQTRQF